MATLYELIRFIGDDWGKYANVDDLLDAYPYDVNEDTRTRLDVILAYGVVADQIKKEMDREVTAWAMCDYNQLHTVNQYTKEEVKNKRPYAGNEMEYFNEYTMGVDLFTDIELYGE